MHSYVKARARQLEHSVSVSHPIIYYFTRAERPIPDTEAQTHRARTSAHTCGNARQIAFVAAVNTHICIYDFNTHVLNASPVVHSHRSSSRLVRVSVYFHFTIIFIHILINIRRARAANSCVLRRTRTRTHSLTRAHTHRGSCARPATRSSMECSRRKQIV